MSIATMDNLDSPFLDRAALASLRHLRVASDSRAVSHGPIVGHHRSRRPGGAAEFIDYRPYIAGDDLRRLDWKLLARSGRPFVRRFEDESSLRVTIMLDASASMDFNGGRGLTKLQYAQHVAASLVEIVARQHEEIGVAIAADALVDFVSPGAGATQAQRTQAAIVAVRPQPVSRLDAALLRMRAMVSAPGTLILISDFLVDEIHRTFAEIRALRGNRWQVRLLHVVHPSEERLPDDLAMRFDGLEGEESITCAPAAVASEYDRRFRAHGETIRRHAVAAGCGYQRVSTVTPWIDTVRSFLVPRGG